MKKQYRIVPENDTYGGEPGYMIQWSCLLMPWWERLDYHTYSLEDAKKMVDHLSKKPIYHRPE